MVKRATTEFAKDGQIQPFLSAEVGSPAPKLGNSHMETLLQVVQKLSLAKDLETIMFIVRKAARQLTGADGATFVLRDDDKCYYADEDAIAPLWKGKRFPMKLCISGWVMEHCQPVVIEDIYADPRIPADAYRPTFVKSLAMVPIRTTAPIGAIGTYWADYNRPTSEQVDLLQALADSTSIAMQNIELHSKIEEGSKETSAQLEITRKLMEANQNLERTLGELNRRNEQMQSLKELSSNLQTAIYVEEAYKLIAQYTEQLLPNVAGILYLMHPSKNYLEAMTSWCDPLSDEKIIKPEECLSLRRGSIYKVENAKKELTCSHYIKHDNSRPYMCIPLFAQSDITGMLYLEWQDVGNPKEQYADKRNEEILASTIAEQIAIGISNIKLRETLRNLSFRDTLTGLYNRRYLEETLERDISRCERNSSPLVIMMIDIDHFKQFNDVFGHEAGDMVIQSLASVLRNFARKSDIVCRYGGDEFIMVVPEMDSEAALIHTEELHRSVDDIHLRYGDKALGQITISVGIGICPIHGKTMRELIEAADRALYQAKNSGRNKTVIYNQ